MKLDSKESLLKVSEVSNLDEINSEYQSLVPLFIDLVVFLQKSGNI